MACVATLVAAASTSSPAAAAPNAVNTTAVNAYSHTCLDNDHALLKSYNKVQGWACNGTPAQSWTFYFVAGTALQPIFEIGPAGSSFCLDDYHSIAQNGNPVDLYPCNGTTAQLWRGVGTSLVSEVGSGTTYCLDLSNGNAANGTKVQIFTCNNTDPQHWQYLWQP